MLEIILLHGSAHNCFNISTRKSEQALRQVLEMDRMSQNRSTIMIGVGRLTMHDWFNDIQDPSAEAVTQIVDALQTIARSAAKECV